MSDKSVTVTKRGRPPKGERPMSGCERKRSANARQAGGHRRHGDEQNASLRALLAILARVETSEPARLSAQRAWAEFGRRYGFVSVTKQARGTE
jgi:hypothetical protein